MRYISNEFNKHLALGKESKLSIFKYPVINKMIDITKKLNLNEGIKNIRLRE